MNATVRADVPADCSLKFCVAATSSDLFGVPGSSESHGRIRGGDEGGGGGDQAAGTCTVTIKAPNLGCFKRFGPPQTATFPHSAQSVSEERRVGKECRSR